MMTESATPEGTTTVRSSSRKGLANSVLGTRNLMMTAALAVVSLILVIPLNYVGGPLMATPGGIMIGCAIMGLWVIPYLLPAVVVGGSIADSVAVWRGAFLARGSLTEPGRSMALEVTCPGSEAALALSGAARRLGITVKSRESRGVDRVVLRDGEAIADLLTRMGAQETRLIWEERRMRREVKAQANRLANFDDANLRRSARAAVAASARVERALEILGEDAPAHLVAAGKLRIEHRQASLEELGKLHDPPLTKDAVAGRIRRLLATADKAAEAAGIPNTEASLPADLGEAQ